jgi:putative acetyltransferase
MQKTTRWSIRDAVEADVEAIARVRRDSVLHFGPAVYPPEVVMEWAESARSPGAFLDAMLEGERFFVAVDETGDVVGFSGYVVRDGKHRTGVYIDGVVAAHGIGRALIDRAIAEAAHNGAEEIHIDASLNAVRFYERRGFVRVAEGRHVLRDGTPMQCVQMVKKQADT